MPDVTELAVYPELRLGHVGPLLVAVWKGEVTSAAVRRLAMFEGELVERYGGVSVLNVVTDSAAGRVDADLVHTATELTRRFDPYVRGAAIVVETEGKLAGAALVALEGMLIIIGEPERYRLLTGIEQAVQWLTKPPHQDAELAGVVRRFVTS